MRIAYLGTSDYAAVVLAHVAASKHEVALAVTPPDSRRGRGRSLKPPPVAEEASRLGIPLWQAANVNEPETLDKLAELELDCLVVCAFGQMIRAALLDNYLILNVHPSLLPRWRGAAPIERAIMAGDEKTGVGIMQLEAGLDSGPVALERETPIEPDDNFGTLEARLANIGGELLVEALDQLAEGKLEFTPQTEEGLTYAEKIDPSERRLDPARTARELELVVRGLNPHVGTYLELEGGDRLGVKHAKAVDVENPPAQGELAADSGRLILGCAEGTLAIPEVQPPGKKPMDAAAYLNGRGNQPPALAAADTE